jgi:hypothetical protein
MPLDTLRWLSPDLKQSACLDFYDRKYRSDQARVPAGNPDGGQWTSEANPENETSQPKATVQRVLESARRAVAASGGLSYQRCLDLCYPLLERFQRPGSDRNTWDFHKCMNICLKR